MQLSSTDQTVRNDAMQDLNEFNSICRHILNMYRL